MKLEGPGESRVHHPSHNVKFITCIGKKRILIYNLTEALWEKEIFFFFVFKILLLFKALDWDLAINTSCSLSPR